MSVMDSKPAPVGVLRPHDQVHLWHPPQQGCALLLRHAPSHHDFEVAHVHALALGLHMTRVRICPFACAALLLAAFWLHLR